MVNKKEEYIRWAIITKKRQLYVGHCLTRKDAVAQHVEDLYGISRFSPRLHDCWRECQATGDRAVKVRIIVDE